MQSFILLWLGQLASSIGSSMTYFALTLWVWQQTESVTAIALISFFFQLPQIGLALFSGLIVDRFPRKQLLILSDVMMAGCSLAVGILFALHQLQLWHLYTIAAIYGCFSHLQTLTQTTLIPLLVPPQHHARASSMGSVIEYSTLIFAPAIAGVLCPKIGLFNITLIDLATFLIAIFTLAFIPIIVPAAHSSIKLSLHAVFFGFRYIATHANLTRIMILLSCFAFAHQLGETLFEPMILAQTHGNAQVLGAVSAASGIGGVVGGVVFSLWGGFQYPVRGMLFGFVGTGISKLILGITTLPLIWMGSQFLASMHTPLIFSSYMALWYAKVDPKLQGRVFAADHLIGLVVGAIASLVADPLADRVFEPLLQSDLLWLSRVVGQTPGSGTALLYGLTALCILLVSIIGFTAQRFQHLDDKLS
ncbi:MAG: MFS transporter [Acaryochloris sp. SU_5_25]|nr:MFS transporter [Acaryochloris sp. SU_5_25]